MGKYLKQRSSCNAASRRAWRLLRLALLWARKGGLMKGKLMAEIRHVPKYLKGLNHKHSNMDMIRYGEKQLSFDETPVIHLKMSRPASLRFMIPCIKPDVVDFDYDFGNDNDYDDIDVGYWRKSFLESNSKLAGEISTNQDDYEVYEEKDIKGELCEDEQAGEGIDVKAEEFIANFYQQMKLQREISFQRRQNCHNNGIPVLV